MSYTKALRETLRHGEELNAEKVADRIGCTLTQARSALNNLWNSHDLERVRIGHYRKNPTAMRRKPRTVSQAWMTTVWRIDANA